MKRIFTLFLLTLFVGLTSWSQNYINYDRDTRWFMGINGGATFHTQTETPILYRGGYGFTMGTSIGMDPRKFFSWDIRARFLHAFFAGQGESPYALDSTSSLGLYNYGTNLLPYQDSIGYFVPNFRTTAARFSLELVLNTNRLRERTGWNFSIFGGIGFTGYHVKTDLYNNDFFSNSIYDYNSAGSLTQSNLLAFQDNDFETDLVGTDSDFEWEVMPSFGVGISYQLSPAVAFGLEHKMTWTRTDNFDGMPNTYSGVPSSANDVYHYTSLGFKFHLFHGNGYIDTDTDVDNFDTDTQNDIVQQPVQKPVVEIYDPGSSPYTTTWNQFTIKANIYHVDGKAQVTFKQNGNVNTNFTYDPYTDQFSSVVVLQPGQNLFEISAYNDAGSDYETTIIIYQIPTPVPVPPIVTITNPPYSPYTTMDEVFNMTSTVLNVDSKSQIQVYFNGTYVPGFSYNSSTDLVTSSLNLHEGTNTVTVTATNSAGSDSKTATIIYTKPATLQPPVVTYVSPAVNPYNHNTDNINVVATVLNVTSQADITVKVNGVATTNFAYNITTKELLLNTNLVEGANFVETKAVNAAGMDVETTTIIYVKPNAPKPPVVTFLDPITDPITVFTSSYNVVAKVENVSGASAITLKINGVTSTSFTYSNSSQLMTFTTGLLEGSNVIEIKGVNDVGQDIETTTIVYKKSIPQAPPVVTITFPAIDNVVFNTPNVVLTATVLNVASASNIQVVVNGNTTTAFDFNTSTKILTLPLVLVEGNNTIQITGTNSAGTDSKTRIIIYNQPTVPTPPTVVFVNPSSSPYLSPTQAYTVMANTTNISSKGQIVFKMNGSVIPDANYTLTSTNQVIYNSNLLNGNNIFEISVSNAYGSDEALALVTYNEPIVPCIIPTVGYISPVPYSTVTNANVTIDAQINNYSAGTTVELKINGVSQGYMTYNSGTSIASKSTVLTEGSNAVSVIVTNACGTNMATFTLNYQIPNPPCTDPTVYANGTTSIVTQDNSINLSAVATGVPAASNISVTLNGSSIPFTYDLGTGNIAITNAALAIGNNSLLISVSNACGSAVLAYNIVRQVCNAPTISAVNPANGSTTTNATINFSATVNNALASEISIIFNGISQVFDYNAGTHILSAPLNLNVGANAITIQVTTACGTASQQVTITREIPCDPIAYSLVSPAASDLTVTNSAYSILLHTTGSLTASQISATLNGSNLPFTFDPITGNIAVPALTLVDGMNTVVFNMNNACSAATVTYHIQYNGCQPPVITITSIANGATVNTSSLAFAASVLNSNGASNVALLVNGNAVGFDFNESSGLLSSSIVLNEGANTITLNVAGCQNATQTITVNYVIPCQDIVATLMQPSTNAQVVTESLYAISLAVQNVDNAAQITVTQNGVAIPFNFNAGSGIISITGITLTNGANNFVVTATNQCSSITTNYTIQYNGCQPPVVTISSSQTAVSTPVFALSATVTNIANQADIQVLLNGAPVVFVFNPITGQLNAEVNLNQGVNTIQVVANGCQTATQSTSITYTIPCVPITYALGTPSSNSISVADAVYAIELFAQHVSEANISVNVNGSPAAFTYINDIISINNIALNNGNNTVTVAMSNNCSNETVTYTIVHNNCNTPVIDLSSNNVASSTAAYAFSATVQNIDSQSQLQLTVNGTSVPFTYTSGLVTASLNLNVGSNTIVLSANACASASETINVVYTIPCYPVTYSLLSPAQLNTSVQGATTSISLGTENVSGSSNISTTLNGNAVPFTFSGNTVTLSGISLNPGANTVVIVLSNSCSSETITYNIDSDQCEAPTINLTSVNTTVNDPLFYFAAQIYNVSNANDIQLLVNGTAVNFDFNAGAHNLTAQFSLQVEANAISVVVNGCETVTANYTINYVIPCNPITYSLQSPASATATVTSENYQISLNTTNVPAQSNIGVFLNGNAVPFTFTGNVVSASTIVLQPGVNTITVTLTNDCSSETVTYSITYNAPAPCNAPVITFSSNNATDNASYVLNAVVTNIDNASLISVTLNGVPVTANYNSSSDVLTANMTLANGSNTIALTANGCETASAVFTVTYTPVPPPCNPPVITFSSSPTSGNSNYIMNAVVTNIANAAAISVTLNGVPVSASYNTSTGALSANLILTDGANSIVVVANGCQVSNGSFTVTYDAPECGTRINPGNSEWEFCLITPGGTYNRDNLHNNSYFTYSGPATSLYCKPIAGGGDAFVNGQAYPLVLGNYYLFTGNLTVTVSNDNPGAMGHWVVCIQADNNPVYGNGANRPDSPCEVPPCDAPVITYSSANTSSATAYNLVAVVSNIDSPSAITVTLNGQPVSAAYNTGTDQLTANLTLVAGNNTIAIQANGCSVANGSLTVNCTPPADTNVDFDVQNNGTVTVNETACATITCLGESVVYSNSQEAYVKIQFSLNGGSSWYGFANDQNVAGGETVSVNSPAGSNVVIKATCTNANQNWSNTLLSNSGSEWVYVLQNGDVIPNYDPASGQLPLDAFLAGYITSNGVVTIGPNDVIYLYELRHVGSTGIDYQDVVMLVSFSDNPNCPAPVNPKSAGGQQSGEVYQAPQLTMIQPATPTVEVSTPQYAFRLRIDKVNAGEDIQVSINGAAASGFNYNFGSKELTGNIPLVNGANVIQVTAVNGNQTTSGTYTITYKPKETVVDQIRAEQSLRRKLLQSVLRAQQKR